MITLVDRVQVSSSSFVYLLNKTTTILSLIGILIKFEPKQGRRQRARTRKVKRRKWWSTSLDMLHVSDNVNTDYE